MERIRLETDRDERIRRQVRENSLELRELENKLRDAYTGRARVYENERIMSEISE